MAEIHVPYERKLTDSDLTEIVDRSDDGLSVLGQLGADYHTLPGYKLVDLQAKNAAVKDDITLMANLAGQMLPVLQRLDANGAVLSDFNLGLLPLLRGALKGKPEEALLDRITGPTQQGSPAVTPPAPTP